MEPIESSAQGGGLEGLVHHARCSGAEILGHPRSRRPLPGSSPPADLLATRASGPYIPRNGILLTQDPIGLAGGVNLYAYAGNNPVAFRDPFGLCATGNDSVKVAVSVDCGDGTTSRREVWAQRASDNQIRGVVTAAGRLTGGTAEITPAMVRKGYQLLADAKSIYVLPMEVDGRLIREGAVTKTGGGEQPYTAFRVDALEAIASGDLGATIGDVGFNAATILGHEGAHLWGSRHPETYDIPWGFTP